MEDGLERIEIEPVEKIAIYHEFGIDRARLIPSYISVCKRDKALGRAEGARLGLETALLLAEARERFREKAAERGIRSPRLGEVDDAEVESLVRELFNIAPRSASRPTSPTAPITRPSQTHGSTASISSVLLGTIASLVCI